MLAVIPDLTTRLGDGKTVVAQAATEALTRLGSLAVPGLINVLQEASAGVNEPRRMWAARALGWLGPLAQPAVPAMIRTLSSEKTFVVEAVAEALGRIGPATAEAIPALVDALRSPWEYIRQAACTALGRIGPAAIDAVLPLIRALADSQQLVQTAAAEALCRIGPSAKPAVRRMILDRAEAVQLAKAAALQQVSELAVPVFLQELDRWDRLGRANAVRVLVRLEPDGQGIEPAGFSFESMAQADRFSQAIDAAITEIAAQALPQLLQRLGNSDSVTRQQAAEALGRLGPAARDAVDALEQTLNDANEGVRLAAAEALNRIRGVSFGFGGARFP
jgi:HEAT repeat protein